MKIYYGTRDYFIDVTTICYEKLMKDNIIKIPSGDNNRAHFFKDPLQGIHKMIFIENEGNINEYDEYKEIKINLANNIVINDPIPDYGYEETINKKLQDIHSKLEINYGSFNDELPEQKMVARYLTGNEKVLEIGGNIGRNSLVIASILNTNNLVCLESDANIARQLEENRDLNNFSFYIEPSALSKRKLIQRGWNTIPSDNLLPGYTWVNTISLEDLKRKYKIDFDTLVLDCEGALYYILMDMPEILNNINLIIMENDYLDISNKNYVDDVLKKNNFYRDYVESGGWRPCYDNFFEVWKKSQ
jgi:FkbM family methyltransferase